MRLFYLVLCLFSAYFAAGSLIPENEWRIIRQVAVNYELTEEQTWVLAAVRRYENGRPGLEFGIGGKINNGHPSHRFRDGTYSFRCQCEWAAGTIKKRFKKSLADLGKRYCPYAADKWIASVAKIVRQLKAENRNALPGATPAKNAIKYPDIRRTDLRYN